MYKDFTQLSSLGNTSCGQELATLQSRMQLTAFWAGMADRFADISAHFEISVIGIGKSLGCGCGIHYVLHTLSCTGDCKFS